MNRFRILALAVSFIWSSLSFSAPDPASWQHTFEDQLVAERAPTSVEVEGMAAAARSFAANDYPANVQALEKYLVQWPASPWRASVLVNLADAYFKGGYFSRSVSTWQKAVDASKAFDSVDLKAVGDRAIAELAWMYSRLGEQGKLEGITGDYAGRSWSGASAEMMQTSADALFIMKARPSVAFRCGPEAMSSLIRAAKIDKRASTDELKNSTGDALAAVMSYPSQSTGVRLSELAALSAKHSLGLVPARRIRGAAIPVPSVVHWKVNHYAAIVSAENGAYRVVDPTFGGEFFVGSDALLTESSGYFLADAKTLSQVGLVEIQTVEADLVVGKGLNAGHVDNNATGPESPKAKPDKCAKGLCQPNVQSLIVSLQLRDVPVSYKPPRGPWVTPTLLYNQREVTRPSNIPWFNFGQKWMTNLQAWILDAPSYPSQNIDIYDRGGGTYEYTGYNSGTGAFALDRQRNTRLVRVSTSPIRYERRFPDGSMEVYDYTVGGTGVARKVWLTKIVDPQGLALTFTYDASLRLTAITDADGRVTQINYAHPVKPLLVTSIVDPFGRSAVFSYDASYRLASIQDAQGITASFTYAPDSTNWISGMTTPYGAWSFTTTVTSLIRSLSITDPRGNTERFDHRASLPEIPAPSPVPTGFGATSSYGLNDGLYWDAEALSTYGADPTKAILVDWLLKESTTTSSHLPGTRKNPLESRIFFSYPGQTYYDKTTGTTTWSPSKVGRVLPDGTTSQISFFEYNGAANITKEKDPKGRELQYTYDANGVDLLAVKRKVSAGGALETLAAYTWNGAHRPLTYTDAAGETWTFTYTTGNQIETVTNPKSEVTTYHYDSQGFLTSITNPNNNTQAAFTYDAVGRLATETDSEGRTVGYVYDNLDRLITKTFPDGTTEVNTWTALDRTAFKDRLNRTTTYTYDAARNLTSITDPSGRTTAFTYDRADRLKTLIDGEGNTTTWVRDVQGRVVQKIYPDLTTVTTAYDSVGRVASVTDALGQVKTYGYATDDSLLSLSYTNAVAPTPGVTYTYDPYFPRLTSMTDGHGTTSYSYHPTGYSGAGLIASEQGPHGASDLITYAYDELGRVETRVVAGSAQTLTFDALGRVSSETNALGSFAYQFLGETQAPTQMSLSGGAVGVTYTYETNANDRRLKSIENWGAAPDFYFLTDAVGRIRFRAPAATGLGTWYDYDGADRLIEERRGVSSSGGGTPSLSSQFFYDDADNLIGRVEGSASWTATTNSNNQLASVNGSGWSYDANGNLLHDGARSYVWDAENRMVQVTDLADGSITDIAYNGNGQRAEMIERALPTAAPSVTRQLWCGDALCAKIDATGNVFARYFVQGEQQSATESYFATDQLGSVTAALDSTSAVQGLVEYGAYGEVLSTSGALTDRGYAQMFRHTETGLGLAWFRAYEPNSGRWLSRDPLEEEGSVSLYTYVDSDPVNYIDPTGEIAVVGAFIGLTAEIGMEALANYRNGCDVFDYRNYDPLQIGLAALVGAVSPGSGRALKTAVNSTMAKKSLKNQLQSARTAARKNKLRSRISNHSDQLVSIVGGQVAWMGLRKVAGTQSAAGNCECDSGMSSGSGQPGSLGITNY